MIKTKAKAYSDSLFTHPHELKDLELFAKQLLSEFIKELESEKQTVKWNYGLDEVIFLKKLEELKESYGVRDDQSDTIIEHGVRTSGSSAEDKGDDI